MEHHSPATETKIVWCEDSGLVATHPSRTKLDESRIKILRVFLKFQKPDYLVELSYFDYRKILARTPNKTETR